MGWVKLDDQRAMNRKLRAAGFAARGLDEAALCQVAADQSDGHISEATVETLAVAHRCKTWRKLAAVLVQVGRWEQTEDGWIIHDYLHYNPSRAEWADEKAKKAAAGSKGGKASAQARATASGQATATADGEANGQADPTRPEPLLLTSPPPLTVVSAPTEAAAFIAAVVETVARRQLAATKTRRQVDSETGWLTIARRNLTALHAETISQAHAFGQAAQDVADRLEPPPKTPVDTTRRDYAHLRPDCPDTPAGCGGSGMILAYDGTAQRCPMCNPVQAGA